MFNDCNENGERIAIDSSQDDGKPNHRMIEKPNPRMMENRNGTLGKWHLQGKCLRFRLAQKLKMSKCDRLDKQTAKKIKIHAGRGLYDIIG